MDAQLEFVRGATVLGDGAAIGRLTYVIVDESTAEATDIVVAGERDEWLVPMRFVESADDSAVRLHGPWASVPTDRYDPTCFHEPAETVETYWTDAAALEDTDRIVLRAEELLPRKRTVPAGEVVVGKSVVAEERTMKVPVTREEVVIERVPTDGEPTDRGFDQRQSTIRMPILAEQVRIEKQPVVTEEVEIGKRVVQESVELSETVLHEEAVIRTEGNVEKEQHP
jgi:uncharacterized protein (TIGR02271 family)